MKEKMTPVAQRLIYKTICKINMMRRIEVKGKMSKTILNQLVNSVITKKYIYGAVFYISYDDNSIDLISASGNIKEESQYYIASINKFFVSAIILKLYTKNKLDLQFF